MSNTRSKLIRTAHALPVGNPRRRAILSAVKAAGTLQDADPEATIGLWLEYVDDYERVIKRELESIENAVTDNFIDERSMQKSIDDRVEHLRKGLHRVLDAFVRDAKRQGLLD
jgi:hypothetical protein